MKFLGIDLETYSSANLIKSGVYRYCEAEDFEILLFGYSVDGGEVKVVDLARGEMISTMMASSNGHSMQLSNAFVFPAI